MKKLLFFSLLAISNCSLFSNDVRCIDLSNKALGSDLNSYRVLKKIYEKNIRQRAFNCIDLRGNRLDLMDDKNWDALLDIIETLRDFGNGVWIGLESTNLKYVSQEYLKRLGQSIKKTGCGTVYPCLQGNRLHVPYWECPTALDIVDELNPKTKSGDFSSQNMVYIDFDPELRFPIFDDVDNRTDANNNDNSSSHSQISDFRHELGLSTSDEVDDDSDDDSDDNSSHTQKLKKNRCSSSRNPKYCNQN